MKFLSNILVKAGLVVENTFSANAATNTIYAGTGTRLRTEANNLVFERVSSSGIMKMVFAQGTLSPSAKAYIGYSNATLNLILANEYATAGLELRTSDIIRQQIFANGNIVIGQASPVDAGYKVDITGTARVTGIFTGSDIRTGSHAFRDQMYITATTDGWTRQSAYNAASAFTLGFVGDLRFGYNTAVKAVFSFNGSYSNNGTIYFGDVSLMKIFTGDAFGNTTGATNANGYGVNLMPTLNYTTGTSNFTGYYYNPTLVSTTGLTHYAMNLVAGLVKVGDLSGTGTRMVVADSSGVLSTQAITAGITGSGSTGQLAYWNGSSSQAGTNNLFWDIANNRLGFNTTNPQRTVHIYNSVADNHLAISGPAPSVSLSDSVTGSTHQAKFGLATASGHYAASATAGDFVIISQTGSTIWMTSNVERLKLSYNGNFIVGGVNDTLLAKLQVVGAIQQSTVTSSVLKADANGVLVAATSGSDFVAPATLASYVPTSRTITINGVSYDLSADRSWSVTSMVYPGAGIAVSTGSSWATSITDNSSNWNAAYSWGNHASAGYLTASSASSTYLTISNASSTYLTQSSANTIYLNKNDASSIYLSQSSANTIYLNKNDASSIYLSQSSASTIYLSIGNASTIYLSQSSAASIYASLSGSYSNPSWITSLAWSKITGAPAFLTSYTETDTLASVTGRGATTSTAITISGIDSALKVQHDGTSVAWRGRIGSFNASADKSSFLGNYTGRPGVFGHNNALSAWDDLWVNTLGIYGQGNTYLSWFTYVKGNGNDTNYAIWHAGNLTNLNQLSNGPGYITSSALSAYLPLSGGTLSGNLYITNSSTVGAIFISGAQSGARQYMIQNGITGISNSGLQIRDVTGNASLVYFDTGYNASFGAGIWATSGNFSAAISASNISSGINASHIVQRDANGYIYANHINFNTSESENPAISSFITSNGDGWSRKSSIQHVRNQLGNYGGWITGYTETDTLASVTGRGASTSTALSINNNITITSGRLIVRTGGANTYGIVSGYDNNNHMMTMRASVTGATASPTYTAVHQMTFVEYAQAGDDTGWFFKSSSNTNYEEIARITRTGINWNGNTVIHSGNIGSQSVNYANSAGSVSWGNVSSRPSNIMYYQSFTLDANTMDSNATGFTYSVNAPFTGPIARFSTGGSYDMWLGGNYGGSGNVFYIRTRNGDSGTFNPWRLLITDGNIGSQSVSYASSAGSLSSMNISQFTNNSGYLTSVYGWTNTPDSWYGIGQTTSASGATAIGGYYPWALSYHTGLALSAHSAYGGIRFYNQNYPTGPLASTPVMQINNSQVYINSNLTVTGIVYANTHLVTPTIYSGGGNITFGNNVGNFMVAPTSASWAEGISFTMPSTSTWGGLRWRRERGNSDGNWYIGFTALDSSDDLVFGANNGGGQVDNILRLQKDGSVRFRYRTNVFNYGSGGGENLFTGLDSPTSANGRAQFVLSSSYSDLVIASSQTNSDHGSTISFVTYNPGNAGDYRKFVINQGNWGARAGFLDFGFSDAGGRSNPHLNINSTDDVMSLDGYNKRVGVNIMSPSYTLDVNGLVNTPSGYISVGNPWSTANSAFFPNGITTAGGTNWVYGLTYLGNAPANGSGAEVRANGSSYFRSSNVNGTWGYAGQFVDRNNAQNNYVPWSFENEYGTHSWGIVARFHIQQASADKPSIQFSAAGGNDRWSIGYCTGSDWHFRINQNQGYRTDNSTNDGWGTERFKIDTGGSLWANGPLNLGPDSGADNGLSVRYGGGGYGRIRFYSDGSNHQTIHAFGTGWTGGGVAYSNNSININGGSGVTFGAWNVPDGYIATGGSAWFRYDVTAYSDARVKKDIININNPISKIQSINGVTFARTDKQDGKRYAGVIAQEVLEVLPEVVSEDEQGMYSVSYGNMAGLFIEAIKEQQKQIEELKSIIDGLTK